MLKKKLDLKKKKLFPPFISITINVSHCENRQSCSHSWKSHFVLLSALSARQRFSVKRISWWQKNQKLHRGLRGGRQRLATVDCPPSLIAFIWHSKNRHWILVKLDCKILVKSLFSQTNYWTPSLIVSFFFWNSQNWHCIVVCLAGVQNLDHKSWFWQTIYYATYLIALVWHSS